MSDTSAYIFSLVNTRNQPCKLGQSGVSGNGGIYAVYTTSGYGPCFGGGWDFQISDQSNTNSNSYANLGFTYQYPSSISAGPSAQAFLAGSYYFQTAEVEAYTINSNSFFCFFIID